jgi:hypothetical protein
MTNSEVHPQKRIINEYKNGRRPLLPCDVFRVAKERRIRPVDRGTYSASASELGMPREAKPKVIYLNRFAFWFAMGHSEGNSLRKFAFYETEDFSKVLRVAHDE